MPPAESPLIHAASGMAALTMILLSAACTQDQAPAGAGRYSVQKELASEHASLSQLQAGLDDLEAWHHENGTAVSGRFGPGLDVSEIRDRSAQLGMPLPEELVALYQWHDGTENGCDDFAGPALIGYHCFLSLDEALARRDEDRRVYGFPDTWFPLLMHQEEYFYVVLQDTESSALPIHYRLLEGESMVAFTNLRTLVDTYVEAAQGRAWHPDDPAKVRWGEVEAIRARRNPMTDPPWAP